MKVGFSAIHRTSDVLNELQRRYSAIAHSVAALVNAVALPSHLARQCRYPRSRAFGGYHLHPEFLWCFRRFDASLRVWADSILSAEPSGEKKTAEREDIFADTKRKGVERKPTSFPVNPLRFPPGVWVRMATAAGLSTLRSATFSPDLLPT